LDHLIRPREERRRDGEAERLGSFQVNHEHEFRRLLNWEISRLGAPENLVDVGGGPAPQLRRTRAILYQAANLGKAVFRRHRREPILKAPLSDLRAEAAELRRP